MKRALILAAFFAGILLTAMAGVALGRLCLSRSCGPAADTRALQLQDTAWLTHHLKLIPEQQAAMQRLDKDYRDVLAAQCAIHCATRAKLQAVLFPATTKAEETAIQALVEELGKAQTACELATIQHIQNVHALLTPAQQSLYEKAVVASVFGVCPTGLHFCQEPGNGPPANRTSEAAKGVSR